MSPTDHPVAPSDELDEGDHLVVELEGREVGVFNVGGELYAYANWCAHQSGPACEGPVTGLVEATYDREALEQTTVYRREGEILNCAWHGWEYDLLTGECLSKEGVRLPAYPVRDVDGTIVVSI